MHILYLGLKYNNSERMTDDDVAGPVIVNVPDTINIYLILSNIYTSIALVYIVIRYTRTFLQRVWKIINDFVRIKDD